MVTKTLDRSGGPELSIPPEPRRRSFAPVFAAMLLAIVAAGAGGWMYVRQGVAAEKPKPVVAAATVVPVAPLKVAPVPPAAVAEMPGHLGVNAFPWANVTSIRNIDNGQSIEIGSDVVTPAPFDLPPGRYEVTLANPQFAQPITRTIAITAGADATLTVHFADPASAALPDFGAAQ